MKIPLQTSILTLLQDEALRKAIERADEKLAIEKAKLEEMRWKLVSANLKTIKPVTNFSQRACADRYEALEAGTAKVPPELIEDKTEDVLKRIKSRQDKECKLAGLKVETTLPGDEANQSMCVVPRQTSAISSIVQTRSPHIATQRRSVTRRSSTRPAVAAAASTVIQNAKDNKAEPESEDLPEHDYISEEQYIIQSSSELSSEHSDFEPNSF